MNNTRIAIVDDDPALLNALWFALEAEGYMIDAFHHAKGVLEAAKAGKYACLVVDEGLPDVPGLALIRDLRERGISSPAILITTQPDASCRRAAATLGVPIVEKPLIGEELSQQIRALVPE